MFQRAYGKRGGGHAYVTGPERIQRPSDLPLSPPAGDLSSRSVFSPSPLVGDKDEGKGRGAARKGSPGAAAAALGSKKRRGKKGSGRGRKKRGDCFLHLFSSPDESNDEDESNRDDDDENEDESLADSELWDSLPKSKSSHNLKSTTGPIKPKKRRSPMKSISSNVRQKADTTSEPRKHNAGTALKSIWEIESAARKDDKKQKKKLRALDRQSRKQADRQISTSRSNDHAASDSPLPPASQSAPICSLQGLKGPWSLDDLDDDDLLL